MKNMTELKRMLKSAKEMQERLQKELAEMRVEGTSGGGMVTVVLDGQKHLISRPHRSGGREQGRSRHAPGPHPRGLQRRRRQGRRGLARALGGLGAGLKIPGIF